ncbi:MAG TPA: acyl carrier protein [Bacteroidales bacterium]|nr:acyl carrier protein [Bacteroidales bacterium]HSA43419.1 acyl carrier protein [Bacteroidales bacterium]
MNRDEILSDLRMIMEDVFDCTDFDLSEQTTAAEIEAWDSLSHIRLVVAIERHFQIKFSSMDFRYWNKVGDIVTSVVEKGTKAG